MITRCANGRPPGLYTDAGAETMPGVHDLTQHYAREFGLKGRVHFAGEHTSVWTGWMHGALDSARRVVREINGD